MKPGQFPANPLWWEIAYLGGTIVRGSTREEWDAAPADGILVVRQPVDATYNHGGINRHYTIRCFDHDYYWLDDEGIIRSGQVDDAIGVAQGVKRGAWAEREVYLEAINLWLDDVIVDAS